MFPRELIEACRVVCGVTPWQWAASALIGLGILLLFPETRWGKAWLGEMPLWVMLLAYACLLAGLIIGLRSGHLGPLLLLGYAVALLYIAILVLVITLVTYPIRCLMNVAKRLARRDRYGR